MVTGASFDDSVIAMLTPNLAMLTPNLVANMGSCGARHPRHTWSDGVTVEATWHRSRQGMIIYCMIIVGLGTKNEFVGKIDGIGARTSSRHQT